MSVTRLAGSRSLDSPGCRVTRHAQPGPRGSCAAGAGDGRADRSRRIQAASSVGRREDGAEEDRAKVGQAMIADDVDGPVEIAAIADDELDLVDRFEPGEVGPHVGLNLAGTGRLEVEDDPHTRIDARIDRAAGFQQDGRAGVGTAGSSAGKTSGWSNGSPPVISTRASPSSRRRRSPHPERTLPGETHAGCRNRRTAGGRP